MNSPYLSLADVEANIRLTRTRHRRIQVFIKTQRVERYSDVLHSQFDSCPLIYEKIQKLLESLQQLLYTILMGDYEDDKDWL